MSEELQTALWIIPNYLLYVLLGHTIITAAFKYRPLSGRRFDDIKIFLMISACCWAYFIAVYTIALTGYFSNIDTFINIENFRNYTRILGIFLVGSTGYLIRILIFEVYSLIAEVIRLKEENTELKKGKSKGL